MSLKKQAISGVKWNFVQQFSVQIINFIVQIILARLLMPEMFGLVAMVIVLISIGSALMDSGMTSSLIRTKNPDQIDYSTVFITNLIASFTIYALIFILAPKISIFYNQEILTDITRLLAFSFVIRAFVGVHITKLTKEMNFKLQMRLQIPSVLVAGLIGIAMAYIGYGIWSLVWLNLIQALIFTIQTWLFIPWRPSFIFNKERFKYHFKFGYKLTIASLIDTLYNNLHKIVIGKFFSPAQVGYFTQAENMRLFPVDQISNVMSKVTYPLFSNIHTDEKLREVYRITMKLVLFAVIPMMFFLIIIAEEGFLLIFGKDWLPAVPYFQILAIASIIRPISSYNLNILKVKGRSGLLLKVEIIKKIIGLLALFIGLQFGVLGIVISLTIVSFFWTLINMYFCGSLINYKMFSQIKDISNLFFIGGFAFTGAIFFKDIAIEHLDYLFLKIVATGTIYLILYITFIYIFEKKLLDLIIRTLKNE